MKTKGLSEIVLALSVFLAVVACKEKEAKWTGSISQVEGVTVVANPKEPIYGPEVFGLTEELVIRDEEGQEGYMFENILNLVVDGAENICALDTKAAQIKVFNKEGEFIRAIGKKGQGPGEFMYPLDIQYLPQGELAVNDFQRAWISYFSLEGKYLHGLSTSSMPAFRRPETDTLGNLVAGYINLKGDFQSVLAKFTPDLVSIQTICTQPLVSKPPLFEYFESMRSTNLVWTVSQKDDIFWGVISRYEINVHSPDGKLVKRILRDSDGVTISAKEREDLIRDMFGSSQVPSNITLKLSDKYPPFIRFTCDEEGRLFVQTYEKTAGGGSEYYDVFDPEGKFIAHIALKSRPMVWKNQKLYTIEDEDGLQFIKRYKVTWKLA
jgi:hypothetical protein